MTKEKTTWSRKIPKMEPTPADTDQSGVTYDVENPNTTD